MRTPYDPVERYEIDRSCAAARRRRLTRGVARFVQATTLDHYAVRSIAQLTLTFDDPDYAAAEGAIRRFWHALRRRCPSARYFCWLELQRSGRLHYHAVWLNPPSRTQFDLHQDVARLWGHGRTQGRRVWPKDWRAESVNYVLGYAKKIGTKAYQQDYSGLPRALRTFMSQRLGYELALLDAHRDRLEVRFVGGSSNSARHVADQVEVGAQLQHRVNRGCSLRRGSSMPRKPLLLRRAHTGLPGPTWRRQRTHVVQLWLPRPGRQIQGRLTPHLRSASSREADASGTIERKLGDAAGVLRSPPDVNTTELEQ